MKRGISTAALAAAFMAANVSANAQPADGKTVITL